MAKKKAPREKAIKGPPQPADLPPPTDPPTPPGTDPASARPQQGPSPEDAPRNAPGPAPKICPLLSVGQLIAGQLAWAQRVNWLRDEHAGGPGIAIADESGNPRETDAPPTKVEVPNPFIQCVRQDCMMWAGTADVGGCGLRGDIMMLYKPDDEDESETDPKTH